MTTDYKFEIETQTSSQHRFECYNVEKFCQCKHKVTKEKGVELTDLLQRDEGMTAYFFLKKGSKFVI